MNDEIIDSEARMLPNWRAAMPAANVVLRSVGNRVQPGAGKIRWCRLRAGEKHTDVLPPLFVPGKFIVVLADQPDDALILDVLAAGAAGCCNTHAAPEVLQQVALVVENGGLWVGQRLLQQLIGNTARILGQGATAESGSLLELLSERERQVARMVAGGASNKEIADRLAIAERTVKAHLTAIFEKTGVRDRLQLSLKINGAGR
ncbi:regulatory LuxR family protein [Azonexus fungiphilus]|uniref:Regulatory LuxR family protein n=1 Tax=Azonexus fungiphilus TaxID=146940 RepID=A0A495VN85_9RHOO|nr:response regulator transcription factor [Azonexus fungiphilus]RKT49873.1 regulatory LuxR family protein [Azonexus fungiphilus]